ncbi:dTDP-4-dehydrorhamnose 3,5-epimerase family protein [Benzoatithermus flavus]|uniref:dTDP-4-dehydrorhamnose 3,5-epimerase n=1 Tax=Benzoatithermus flavus TaxID=3108223 RepID=A0ABU8XWB2_9PROT
MTGARAPLRLLDRPLPGMAVLETLPHRDERGSFARCFCRETLQALGIGAEVAQANLSFSEQRGTLRGLHWQEKPGAEVKIVTCLAGALHDIVLDLRPDSPTYGRHAPVELSAANRRIVVVPEGCAHGFLTLADRTLVLYLVSAAYDPARERGVRWDDPAFALPWPFPPRVISPRDAALPDFAPAA